MKRLINNLLLVSIIFLACISLILSSCTSRKSSTGSQNMITIAKQYGLAYAPLEIMEHEKILESNLPGIKVQWRQLENTATIREAMLANEVDAGFMAIPPFLVGWDKGMEWKIACGLSSSPVGLVTYKDNIKSLRDFSQNDRIAMPQPGSVQHILLSMACEREFGDSHKLDGLLVTLSHPDGMNALTAKKDITAHFTTPPYLFKELEMPGMHQILSGKDAVGSDFTFIVGVTTNKLHDNSPEVYKAFVKSIGQSIDFMNTNPSKAAGILSKAYSITEEEVLNYLKNENASYNLKVDGINTFAAFMKKNSYISKTPDKISDVIWEDVKYEN